MSIIFKQIRIGKNGKPFTLYKFRTMIEDANKIGGPSTAADDPRLTKIGKFLRKWQIDELPSFWNVLKGEISLVGPRPEVPEVVALMTPEEKKIILSIKPGITDLATLANISEGERLRGSKDPHQKYLDEIWPEKKRLQIEYIKNRSLWLDIKIIAKTVYRLFRGN